MFDSAASNSNNFRSLGCNEPVVALPRGTLVNDPNDGPFQPKPDMMITSLTNQGNMAQIFVANVGKFRSPPTTVELSIFRRGGGLLRKLTFRVGPLEVGKSSRLRAHSLPLNNVVVVARADPNKQMEEIREDNNGVSMSIGDQMAQAADLAVTKIEFVRNAKEVWVTVHNYGRSTVTQTVPLSLVSHFGLSPGQRQLHKVRNLKPNLFQTFRFKPDRFNSGMQFEAKVDPNNDVPELSKANNRRTATLR